MATPNDYKWMIIVGGIACATMGIGIGANDVANNFGSSIGSGAITFLWGVCIAAVFEVLGAVLFWIYCNGSCTKGCVNY